MVTPPGERHCLGGGTCGLWLLSSFGFGFWIFSRQGPQTGASHRRAVVCTQLAQGCYL